MEPRHDAFCYLSVLTSIEIPNSESFNPASYRKERLEKVTEMSIFMQINTKPCLYVIPLVGQYPESQLLAS